MHRALVVDDSMLIRHAVCRFLEEHGFEVEAASNGVDALKLIDVQCPDLVITDMQMPHMDGAEFIRRMKRRECTAKVPLIVLRSRSIDVSEAEAAADFVVYKDVDIHMQLEQALEALSERV